jgi:hypothetical protein
MYIKTKCPACGDEHYHNIRLSRVISTSEIVAAEITDTCSKEELASSVLHELANHVYNGISTHELCKMLKDQFGVLEQYCCDIVQQLKIEMDMYCPDRQHLYFV